MVEVVGVADVSAFKTVYKLGLKNLRTKQNNNKNIWWMRKEKGGRGECGVSSHDIPAILFWKLLPYLYR